MTENKHAHRLYHLQNGIDTVSCLESIEEQAEQIGIFTKESLRSTNLAIFIGSGCSVPDVPMMGESISEMIAKPENADISAQIKKFTGTTSIKGFCDIEGLLNWIQNGINFEKKRKKEELVFIFEKIKKEFIETIPKYGDNKYSESKTLKTYINFYNFIFNSRSIENNKLSVFTTNYDYLYVMNEHNSSENKYISGENFMKQMRLYNGHVPLKKDPIISTIDEVVSAINFLAEHDVADSYQFKKLQEKLKNRLSEAEKNLVKLDKKLMELHKLSKLLLSKKIEELDNNVLTNLKDLVSFVELSDLKFEDVQAEIKSITKSRNLLKQKFQQTIDKANQLYGIQAVVDKTENRNQNLSL